MSTFDDKTLMKRQYLEDVVIFEDGDSADEAYLIEEGSIQIYRKENGVRHDIATLEEGEIFGEMSLITGKKHTSYAVATEKTLLVLITEKTIEEKLKDSDPLIQALVHLLIKRIYRSNDEKQGKVA